MIFQLRQRLPHDSLNGAFQPCGKPRGNNRRDKNNDPEISLRNVIGLKQLGPRFVRYEVTKTKFK